MSAVTHESHLLDIEEVRQQMKVSKQMIYKLMAEGKLAFVQVGRCRRVSREALLDFIHRNTVLAHDGRMRTLDSIA